MIDDLSFTRSRQASVWTPGNAGPTFHTSQLNALPALTLSNTSASDMYWDGPVLMQSSVFVVFKTASLGAIQTIISSDATGGGLFFRINAAGKPEIGSSNNTINGTGTNAVTAATWMQMNMTWARIPGNWAMRLARASNGTGTSGASSLNYRSNAMFFDFGTGSAGQRWNGQIAELIVFNRVLSSTEITTIESYLNGKYGV